MMSETTIKNLEAMGFKRWQKNSMDRLYVNPYKIGLDTSKYHTGNISSATWCGNHISNSEARRVLAGKYYIDVADESIHASYDWYEIKDKIAELLKQAQEAE